jgi:hypothetical protein
MSSCTDHLIASFLEHFPTFPNSFLVGGAADYFVIELTDQVYSLYEIFNVYLSYDMICTKMCSC